MDSKLSTMVIRSFFIISILISLGFASEMLKHVYFNRVHCKVNTDYCPKPICRFNFITRDVKSFTWICDLTKPIDYVILHITLFYRYRNGYQIFLIDLNVDVCSYYNNKLGSGLMDIVKKELSQYSSNMVHECPYSGNMTIVALPLTGAVFSYIFLPAGEYKLVINGTLDKKKLFGMEIITFFSIPAGRTLEDDKMG